MATLIVTISNRTALATLAVSECEHDVISALQAGAQGYILKGSSGSEFVKAVHAVRGDLYFAPDLAARLLRGKSRRAIVNGNLR